MTKRPEIGPTVGKVTYIHGGAPGRVMVLPPDITLGQLEAAEQHPDVERELRDSILMSCVPSSDFIPARQDISQRDDEFPPEGLRVRPDAPSVHVYYGLDVSSETDFTVQYEADGRDIWTPDQNPAPPQPEPFDLLSAALLTAIVGVMIICGVVIINIFPQTVFAEFLAALPIPR